jgi:hypothetical protein
VVSGSGTKRRRRGFTAEASEVCAKAAFSTETAGTSEGSVNDWSSVKLCDVINLLLGGVLFFSPWLFDLSAGAQWQTASTVGIVIAVLSIAALAAFAVWEEWLVLIAGLALIVSPWLLGFQDSDAMTIFVVIGVIVTALAALEVWLTRPNPPRIASGP